MKILIITSVFPYPPHNNGVALRNYNLIKGLKKLNHNITIISYRDSSIDDEYIDKMMMYCDEIRTVDI